MKNKKQKQNREDRLRMLVSAVIPSVNGTCSKLLYLKKTLYNKVKRISDENNAKRKKGIGIDLFILMCDSNIFHDVLDTGKMSLSKKQFDFLLKEEYNSTYDDNFEGKSLKKIK